MYGIFAQRSYDSLDPHDKGFLSDYEKFNNKDFDNGVYHKFAYKNQGAKANEEGKEEAKEKELREALEHA